MTKIHARFVGVALLIASTAHAETPTGWSVYSPTSDFYVASIATSDPADGSLYAVLSSSRAQPEEFGTLMQAASADGLSGKRVRLSARIRSEGTLSAWLWRRADREDGRSVAFDNMNDRRLSGTTGWSDQSIVLDLPENAEAIAFDVGLQGTGKVFVDAFVIASVGQDVPVTTGPWLGAAKSPVSPEAIKARPENLGFEKE